MYNTHTDIYIYNLHIHIGTMKISGGRGDHQMLGHIKISSDFSS